MNILGASGHGKVIADMLCLNGIQDVRFWDDDESITTFLGCKILGGVESFIAKKSQDYLIAIGNNLIRERISALLLETKSTAIHQASVISNSVLLGVGTVIMANATINTDTTIGKHVIINTNSSVDHDCVLGDFVHISPQAALAGNVVIGEGTHVGIGSVVIQGVRIGRWATIGAGAVVIRDVPDFGVVVGNPGRIIKYNQIV